MNETSVQNNRRLLEVIELLDSKYVEEMFDDLKVPQRQEEPKITWRAPFKHWKHFVALAACVLLLSLAIPTINYVLPRLGIFIVGNAGAGTTGFTENSTLQTESGTDIESTENSQTEMPDFQYSTVKIICRQSHKKFHHFFLFSGKSIVSSGGLFFFVFKQIRIFAIKIICKQFNLVHPWDSDSLFPISYSRVTETKIMFNVPSGFAAFLHVMKQFFGENLPNR